MAAYKLPGSLCAVFNALEIDAGTLCRSASPVPASVGRHPTRNKRHRKKQPRPKVVQGVSKLTDADFKSAAKTLDKEMDYRLVQAFAEVESGGKSGFGASGLPIIAYEGHIFREHTQTAKGDYPYDKDYPLLSYPYKVKAGPEWQKNNKDQTTAWATLTAASKLNEDAALMACSWGMFQVMGFNFEGCGYSDVKSFVAAMKAGEKGQLDAFVGYCKTTKGMVGAMMAKDYAKMARLYNGRDYGDYDARIRLAYRRHGGE